MGHVVDLMRQQHRRIPVERRLLPPVEEIDGVLRDERGELTSYERQQLEAGIAHIYQAIASRRVRMSAKAWELREGGARE